MRILSPVLLLVPIILLVGCGGDSSSAPADRSSDQNHEILSTEIDDAINTTMARSGATAAIVAVARGGVIVYEQAYGFQDLNQTLPLEVDALMRAGSIIKPVTAAAVRSLEANGVLALSDHVFCFNNNAPCWLSDELLPEIPDARVGDITIGQLISHQGGWYRDISNDPLVMEVEIREALGLSGPPTQAQIVQYIMQSPLDFTPGMPDYAYDNYSNFGYLLLGMIIEIAAQSSYVDYVHAAITDPFGINPTDFKLAASRLEEHDSREPNYISPDLCPSIFTPGRVTFCSEEGADLSNWFASGGIITTAGAMALFAQHYRLPPNYNSGYEVIGEPLNAPAAYGSHGGTLPGLSTMVRQLPTGESYAVFLNIEFNLEPRLPVLDSLMTLPTE